jgi:hypothetical protein
MNTIQRSKKITEYYDVFADKVVIPPAPGVPSIKQSTVPQLMYVDGNLNNIVDRTSNTIYQPPNIKPVAPLEFKVVQGEVMATRGYSNIEVLTDGTILAYPPEHFAPVYHRAIFRMYDVLPKDANANIFLCCDEYRNKSHVVAAPSDKFRKKDVELFYESGQSITTPIKLYLKTTCNNIAAHHTRLDASDVVCHIDSLYFAIEFVWEPPGLKETNTIRGMFDNK